MRRKLMLLLTCLLIGIGLVNAQTSKVTGVVTSEEDGLPVRVLQSVPLLTWMESLHCLMCQVRRKLCLFHSLE